MPATPTRPCTRAAVGAVAGVVALALGACTPGRSPATRVARAPSASDTAGIGGGAPTATGAQGMAGGQLPIPDQQTVPSAAQDMAGAEPTDATAVGEAFARGSWSIDTTSEVSEATAEARLDALMTPSLAARVAAAARSISPTATFAEWAAHRVVTRVEVAQTHDPGAPPDTPTAAVRSFAVTVTPVGAEGWAGQVITEVEFITLTRPGPGEPWRIADVH